MNNKEYTVSEVIDSFGMNKHTWLMFMLLALAMILDGYDFMVVNSTNMFVAHTFWPLNLHSKCNASQRTAAHGPR